MMRVGALFDAAKDFGLRARPLLFAALLCSANVARAQVPGEEIARHAFEDGVALEKKGDFAGALAKFKESEQIKATLGNRYHKAYCLEMTGKLAAALIEYEIVDRAARDANKAELVEATRFRMEPLRAKAPQLAVKLVNPPRDAEVTLDGASLSRALLDGKTFRIDPGEHLVAARASGHEPFSKQVTLAESTTTSLEIALVATSATKAVDAPDAPERDRRPDRSRTLPILTTAGAVALAGAGVAAFVIAGQEQDELKKKRCRTSPPCEDDKGATRTFDALALGSWIGAAGLAALSVVLWTSSPGSSAPAARARFTLRTSWVGLEGRF